MQKPRIALRAVTFLGVALAFTSFLHAQMPNPYGSPIPMEKAKLVAAAAAAEAQKNGWTMAISIVDSSGELVFFEKMDGTQLGSIQLSMAKARSAVLFRSEAQKNGWTMAISIVDSSGELVFFEKMDGTQLGSIQLSMAKARSAVLF